MSDPDTQTNAAPAEKVRTFPTAPGVYLMKDAQGRVIYVGKAKNLRAGPARTSTRPPPQDRRICDWIDEVADIDFLAADSEVDALLMEARLIKDIQPKYNHDLKDDKTFPYLQITTGEDFPRVKFTREPLDRGVKLYGPFPRAKSLRGAIQVLQRIFKFRTCSLDIEEDDPRWRWFRPCLLHIDPPVHRPVQPADRSRDATARDIRRLRLFLDGKKDVVLQEMEEEMREASKALQFEKAARLRDEIKALQNLNLRGDLAKHAQPEVFYVDPRKGLKGLKQVLEPRLDCRGRSRAWTSPTWAATRRSARWSRSSTACRSSRAIAATRSRACRASTTSPRSARSITPAVPGPPGARRAVPRHPADRRRQGPAQRGPGRLRGPQGRSRRP